MKHTEKERAATTRDPERTRERILAAALQEFAAKGFAGARVDQIAKRARINKRMLYHYFGAKIDLYREILSRKLAERASWLAHSPEDPAERLSYWFQLACHDIDWMRLLTWEALQAGPEGPVMNESHRVESVEGALQQLRSAQSKGLLSPNLDPRQVLLSFMALTTYPLAFPQITRLVTGLSINDPEFQKRRVEFLSEFAAAFRSKEKTS